jgi:hypothetical protein
MKQIVFITIFSLVFFCTSTAQSADDTIVTKRGVNYLGMNAEGTTGVGLSYINWPGKTVCNLCFYH